MKERPILFSGPMVRAILDGRKTMTRRIVKPQPGDHHSDEGYGAMHRCPFEVGMRLWVREKWRPYSGVHKRIIEFPDGGFIPVESAPEVWSSPKTRVPNGWCPSIHMPRWASRITLEIVSIRVERLDTISEADAAAEGVSLELESTPWGVLPTPFWWAFRNLWQSINGPGSWNDNPWVWVIEFKRVRE